MGVEQALHVMDRTPGQLLQELIKKRKLKKAALGRDLGDSNYPYQLIHRWTLDDGFNEDNQRRVAELLELPYDYFSNPDQLFIRKTYCQKLLDKFLASEPGRKATPGEVRILRSIKFMDDILPAEDFYTVAYAALKIRLSADQFAAALDETRQLLESAAIKEGDPFR